MDVVQVENWATFRQIVDQPFAVVPVYWRGHASADWLLASAFERMILAMPSQKQHWAPGFYASLRDRYLNAFKAAASGLRGSNPAKLEDDEWWALGRHYGLVTPLLDWTQSPYIAAFFALAGLLQEMKKPPTMTDATRAAWERAGSLRLGGPHFEARKCAVFRLVANETLEGDGLRVVVPRIEELLRMHGQRGLFTWLDSESDFEIDGFLTKCGRGNLLTKFVISDQAVLDGLRDLRNHGIDYRLLFPDLQGAAMHANAVHDDY